MNPDQIVRVADKIRQFRKDHPITEFGILTDFTEDAVDGTARVVGRCRVVHLATGKVVALAHGTRALRAPLAGKQGHLDTRDPDRAMTQATGRALGLLGYADGESLEGDTDEADSTGVTTAARPPGMSTAEAKRHVVAVLRERTGATEKDAKAEAKDLWEDMALDGQGPYTTEYLDEAVDKWFKKAEPFGDPTPPDGVDATTGEVTA